MAAHYRADQYGEQQETASDLAAQHELCASGSTSIVGRRQAPSPATSANSGLIG
jgi:hypothetical protein